MASSRSIRGFRRLACGVCAVLAVALAAVCSVPAFAASSLADREVQPVRIEQVAAGAFGMEAQASIEGGAGELALPRFCPTALSASCDPASIEAGVDCGMDWMCGIEPCLCGSSDAWGGCSCSGLETLEPAVAYASSDEGVVRVEQAVGRTWLVPTGPGTAVLTCTASLRHFADTTARVTVTVGDPALADAALLGVVVLAVVLAVAAAAAAAHAVRRRRRHEGS